MNGAAIAGVGAAVPDAAVSSEELERRLGLDSGWIEARTGIRSRRLAGPGDTTLSLATRAARTALRSAGVDAGTLDYVVVATVTPDLRIPAAASLLQSALGCDAAGAYDLNAGCAGFLCGLTQADALVRAGSARHVLVVGVDLMSRIVDQDDPKTGILFGDGAGAAVVSEDDGVRLGPSFLRSDGSRPDLLNAGPDGGKVAMSGREVYRRAVQEMTAAVLEVAARGGVALADVDLVVAHQANGRILDAVAERLELPRRKVFTNIDRYGNTSAASIPIALAEAEERGELRPGDLVVLTAFGSGFAWGAGLVRWGTASGGARALVTAGAARA
ncbi:MAG TPA: beta-ketoacyl-ACP synthase III [Actinomycetota bacterium]|nr:beta-ketoacyl-ACP synthase III [Actinomycetota bacterium]